MRRTTRHGAVATDSIPAHRDPAPDSPPRSRRAGSVLVGLLWCLALLSVVVIGVLYNARLDLLVVKNHGDLIQAHYLALAGIEKTKALLYRDSKERQRSAQNHNRELYDSPQNFRAVPFGRGQFRIFRQGRRDEGGGLIYGVSDEESRLNLNRATSEELSKLYQMSPEITAAILDWRDPNNDVTTSGAEVEYYASLQPPYLPRNGPFQTLREILMVRAVSRELFMGEDVNQNGLLDPEEDDRNESQPPDNGDGVLDAAWSGNVTVDSSVRNENAAGDERVNVQSADERSLTAVHGITAEIAKAIVASRSQKSIESLADLLDVTAANPQNQPRAPQDLDANRPRPGGRPRSSQNTPAPNNPAPQPTGPKLIDENLLMDIADDLTTSDDSELPGVINLNTASPEVLACLRGIDERLAQAIVNYRQSSGFFPNVAHLLKVDGVTREIFKQVAPKVTVRSETFCILSEGTVNSTGARKRIQVIVRIGASDIETLSYREDL